MSYEETHTHTHVRTHIIQGVWQPRARLEIGRRVERQRGWRDHRKEKKRRDLGPHSRLGRPGRTNVFDSPEMNFPAVVTTAAKYVKPSLTVPRPARQRRIKYEKNT